MGRGSRPAVNLGKAAVVGEASDKRTSRFRRGIGASMSAQGNRSQHGRSPPVPWNTRQQALREEKKRCRPPNMKTTGNLGNVFGDRIV